MRRNPMLAVAAFALVAAACGSGSTDGAEGVAAGAPPEAAPFLPPSDADALAHAALPGVEDLAGPGWRLVSTGGDSTGEDSEDVDFDSAFSTEPACAPFADLAGMGGMFSEDGREPAGSASVEFENALFEGFFPLGLEMDVTILATEAEVDQEWAVVEELMGDQGLQTCLARVFETAFTQFGQDADVPGGFAVDVSEARASAVPPNGGVAMALDMSVTFVGIEADMVMEMYFWPYGNAEVSVLVFGSPEALAQGVSGEALAVLDAKLAAAAG